MLKTGAQHLESLRDGRVVYVGDERIDDVTTHPAFRNGAEADGSSSVEGWVSDIAHHRPAPRPRA